MAEEKPPATPAATPESFFKDAAKSWLKKYTFSTAWDPSKRERYYYLNPHTLKNYTQHTHMLNRFFGKLRLKQINLDRIKSYQKERAVNVSPNKINQELNCLRRIMIHGRAWTNSLETDYVPFRREECSIPRAMTREEQEHFLEVAGGTERFLVLYCYSIIVFNTTCSCKEVRELRLEDVSRGDDMVYVRWGKNKYRTRSIPLREDGRWAVQQLLERARWLGCTAPE